MQINGRQLGVIVQAPKYGTIAACNVPDKEEVEPQARLVAVTVKV
jgi:hypothetical protein